MTPELRQRLALAALALGLVVAAYYYRPQRVPDTPARIAKVETDCFSTGGGSFTVTHGAAGAVTRVECGP
jgi:hypothetical protein